MSAIGRRIRWFAIGFGHLAPQQRPRYAHRTADTLKKRLRAQIQKERDIAMRKGLGKKHK